MHAALALLQSQFSAATTVKQLQSAAAYIADAAKQTNSFGQLANTETPEVILFQLQLQLQ